MAESAAKSRTTVEDLEVINAVLDFIRSNLANIERVWGRDSRQYEAASVLMAQQLDENLKKAKLQRTDIADLLQGLSIKDQSAADAPSK